MMRPPRREEISRITPTGPHAAIQHIADSAARLRPGAAAASGQSPWSNGLRRVRGKPRAKKIGQPVQVAFGDLAAADAADLLRLNGHA